jgi:O-methyltransferase involved in polyketide biosynthesis
MDDRQPSQTALAAAAARRPPVGIRVFEVDHPATQRWKRDLLAAQGLTPMDGAVSVAADLEADPLVDRLTAAGFDPARPALVGWLGVAADLCRLDRATVATRLSRAG